MALKIKRHFNGFKSFLKDESGQTSTEYILLVAVVALIVFKFRAVATEKLQNLVNKIFDTASDNIMSEFESLR